MSEGIYFLNCAQGSNDKNALAFYKNLVPFGNDGQFPDVISDISGIMQGSFLIWETGQTQSHTFPDGVTLQWNINKDAASQNDGSIVGSANNGFKSFRIFKDRTRVLFLTEDSFACTTVYFAN